MAWPNFRRASCAFAALSVLLLIGCDYRVASESEVDVCTLAMEPVTAAFKEVPVAEGRSGSCLFRTSENSSLHRRVDIMLITRSSVAPENFDGLSRTAMAEVEQSFGGPPSNEFGDLAKVALAYGTNPSEFIAAAIVSDRGALMEISFSGESFSHDEVVELTRQLWARVADYRRPAS